MSSHNKHTQKLTSKTAYCGTHISHKPDLGWGDRCNLSSMQKIGSLSFHLCPCLKTKKRKINKSLNLRKNSDEGALWVFVQRAIHLGQEKYKAGSYQFPTTKSS